MSGGLGLISLGPQGDAEAQERRAEMVSSSPGEVLGAAVAEGFSDSPGPRMARIARRGYVETGDGNYAPLNAFDDLEQPTGLLPPSPMVPLATLKEQYEIPGVLSFDKDTPQSVAQSLYEHKAAQMRRADVIRRNDSAVASGMAARFVASMIGSIADPVNLAAMFVPGMREASVARMFGVGAGASTLARAGVRAGAGGTAGAAGMLALEPLNYALMGQERDDWTMAGALANVLLGTVAGAGMHSGLGALAERSRGLPDWAPARINSERFQAATPEVQEALARHAIAAQVEGRPVEAAAVLRAAEDLAPDPWRGATVVADAEGRPLRVFHGSPSVFEQFDSAFLGANTDAASNQHGHFFAAEPATAERYASRSDPVASFMDGMGDELAEWDLREGVRPADVRRAQAVLAKLGDVKRAVDDAVAETNKTGADAHAAIEAAVKRVTGDAKAAKMFMGILRDSEEQVGARIGDMGFPEGANIRPSNIKMENPLIFDFEGGPRPTSFDELLQRAKAEGRDGAIFKNVHDAGPMTDVYVVFDPANIRPSWLADAERLRDARAAMSEMEAAQRPDPRAAEPPPPAGRTPEPPPEPAPRGEPSAAAKDVAELEKQIGALDAQLKMREGDKPVLGDRIKEFDALVDEETKVESALFQAAANCIVRTR